MSRVITFSRVFPKYHPKAGQPTFFVEKILACIMPKQQNGLIDLNDLSENVKVIINDFQLLCSPTEIKSHTIRSGNRFKVGDKFSPRVWSGKPYASKQIIIAPDIEVKKVWDVTINHAATWFAIFIEGKEFTEWTLLARNDGLTAVDMLDWFKKDNIFTGQIICWNETINY